MKQFLKKHLLAVSAALLTVISVDAQNIPTLEMDANLLPPTSGFGSSLTPMTSIFRNDLINNTTFVNNAPEINVTVSLRNQQFTGLNYGGTTNQGFSNAQSTGLVFGIGPLTAQDGAIASTGGIPLNRYDFMGSYVGGSGNPQNNMFTTNPTATGTQRGTGMSVLGDPLTGEANGAFQIFTTAQALFGSSNPIGSRVYFGDIVFRFNQPVKNPVIHLAGLGGAYRYCPPSGNVNNASDYLSTFFSTELELVNTGLTSERMSGNTLFSLSGNNILNSNNANPNGGSLDVGNEGIFNNFGAASGSVRLIGTVQEVVYRVYLEGGTSSQFAWSVAGSAVINNNRNPFTGDIWYAAVSLDKPIQQISGTVFNDLDGLADNNINQSAGVPNTPTNVGGTLFANLLDANGLVFASTPVSSDGSYLFDAVPNGSYNVQLSTIPGTQTSPAPATILPTGWVNTGEFNGNTAGSDGNANGVSANVVVSASDPIKTNTNFGIRQASGGPLPISLVDFTATKQFKVVGLNWQTSTEQNSSYFDVEFSEDGTSFRSIGRVSAAGNSNTAKNYSLIHTTPVNGTNYYRLKMVDVDGSFKYSAVRTVKFSAPTSIKIMPNPTIDRVYITSNEGGVLQSVGVYSLDGKLLQQVTNFTLGKSIDLSNYTPSIYILRLIDKDGTVEVIRVVKK